MQSQSLLKVVKRMEKICYQTSMKNITCSPGQNVSLSLNNWFSWKHVFFTSARNSLNCRPLPVALPTLQAAGPSPVLHLRNKLLFFLAKAQVDLDGSEISALGEQVLRMACLFDD